MDYKILETKRKSIAEKIIVGIDPGKEKHQAAVLNRHGVHQKTYTFQANSPGYREMLWKKLDSVIATDAYKDISFAIETSCNLWQTLAHYLHYSGYPVLLVSPLTTHYSHSFIDHDFSHTHVSLFGAFGVVFDAHRLPHLRQERRLSWRIQGETGCCDQRPLGGLPREVFLHRVYVVVKELTQATGGKTGSTRYHGGFGTGDRRNSLHVAYF